MYLAQQLAEQAKWTDKETIVGIIAVGVVVGLLFLVTRSRGK